MDNKAIDITSIGDEELSAAIRLAWGKNPNLRATHFMVTKINAVTKYHGCPKTIDHTTELVVDPEGTPTLFIMWSGEASRAVENIFPFTVEDACTAAIGWLKNAPLDPKEVANFDGSAKKGWRAFIDPNSHYTIVCVQPVWAMFGK